MWGEQFGSGLQQSSALWIWGSPGAAQLCSCCRKESMEEVWTGEATDGRWERETGGSRARILGSDG